MSTEQRRAYEQQFHDEAAVWLQWDQYEAAVLPNVGANLIAFRDTKNEFTLLREPSADTMDDFRANPGIHGIPVLFPPNRYEDGTFTWNNTTYNFPVNEQKTGNHLHGFFHTAQWQVIDYGTTKTESYAVLSISVTPDHEIYTYLPHSFTLTLRYSLSSNGLQQNITVRNDGSNALPCMIAFHTAINAPFAKGSKAADYKFTLTTGKRWELNERMLPTGRFQELLPEEVAMKTEGINPFWADMDNHYTTEPINGRNAMVLTDTKKNVSLVYDVGTAYKQWMIWNNGATEGFFCPEPQLNLVNAPNAPVALEESGFVALQPGEIWEETSRLYLVFN